MGLISSKTLTNSRFTLPYLINADNPRLEYSRYISAVPTKTDTKNQPTKLEFSMVPIDSSFVKLVRGNYISFQTAKYGAWFTGFIINDPELSIIGSQNGQGVYGYAYTAMSDEYLINLKPMGLINPFFNMTHGQILSALIEDLCPGMYDLTNIGPGILQPRYQVNPTDKFTDITKTFCDAAQYVLYAKEGKIYFQPSDQQNFAVTISGNDMHFTPRNLTLTPTSDPIINDATVLGGVEPQGNITEYFAGDGFTGAFNLVYSPYGIDSTVLLTDDFTDSTLDSTLWTLYDDAASFVTLSGGYVNVLGGEADNTFNVHVDSAFPIPVEGQLKLTHGQWDFLDEGLSGADGVLGIICALWTQEPNAALTGCMYGIMVKTVGGVQTFYPIVNGVLDTSQPLAVDTANRYVIRTIVSSNLPFRTVSEAAYSDASGDIVHIEPQSFSATYTFSTLFSVINITTGVLMSQTTMLNTWNATSDDVNYALYIPVASNDLHATFSNITLDYPIQGVLRHAPPPAQTPDVMGTQTDTIYGGGRWPKVYSPVLKNLGQNELDALDGLAPDATIADTVTGANVKSSLLGTPQYNTASAALTYFKDSVALVATTPDQGSLISLNYNVAGTATGRVINEASINSEAAVWKDDGIRAIVKTDCDPKPRSSSECEVTAATLVGESCFQHYEGSYIFSSDYLTNNYEPISGVNLIFADLPSAFPNVQAEEVTEVVTTFDARRPTERFTHTASFGQIDRVAKLLAKYNTPTDVFAPTDSLETPISVGLDSAGLVFVGNVVGFQFAGMDSANYYFSITGQPPTNGGYEVRLSDDTWGSNTSKNFVSRMAYNASSDVYAFSLPRNSRSKIVYAKAFDGRNSLPWSEDITQWGKTNCTVTNALGINPDDDYSNVSTVHQTSGSSAAQVGLVANFGANQDLTITTPVTFTVDLKIPAGRTVKMIISNETIFATQVVTGVGAWQRISLTTVGHLANDIGCYVNVGTGGTWANSFQMTRASFEIASAETQYCATNGAPYGASSRFSSAVRVNFPFIPPLPAMLSIAIGGNLDQINTVTTGSGATATITTIQQVGADGTPTENNPTITNPQVTVTLPAIQLDIFGVEIRAADNTTVLYRQNLTAAGYSIAVSLGNTFSSRVASYYVYTYNVFGEYCAGTIISATIPPPTVASVQVTDATQILSWNGISSTGYTIVISDDSAGTVNPVFFTINSASYDTSNYDGNSLYIQTSLFTPLKYITVTPFDTLSNGTPVQITHEAPTGPPGTISRPDANSYSTATPVGAAASSVSMENSYDGDTTTAGILQASSGTVPGRTGEVTSTLTGFPALGVTSGMKAYALITSNLVGGIPPVGGSGSARATIYAEVVIGSVINDYILYDSSTNGWSAGSAFTVNVDLPAGVLMTDISIVCDVQAPVLVGPPEGGGDPRYYLQSTISMSVYDVYIQ